MALRKFVCPTWTTGAGVGDGANMTDSQHMSLKGGSGTQAIRLRQLFAGGQATAGAVFIGQLARHSVVGATITALASPNSDEPNNPASADLAAVAIPFVASTTKPQSDANAKISAVCFNLFGGLLRESWNSGEGPEILGNTASFGELGLNAFTGSTSGLIGSHLEYEPL